MLLPEIVVYILSFIIGVPIFVFICSGFDGLKEFFENLKELPHLILRFIKSLSTPKKILRALLEDIKYYLLILGFIIFGGWLAVFYGRTWIVDNICPYVVIVNGNAQDIDYKTYLSIGTPIIEGERYHVGAGEVLIVNHSNCELAYREVKYATKSVSKYYHGTSSEVIKIDSCIMVSHYPEYFFTNPPSNKKSLFKTEKVYVLDVLR